MSCLTQDRLQTERVWKSLPRSVTSLAESWMLMCTHVTLHTPWASVHIPGPPDTIYSPCPNVWPHSTPRPLPSQRTRPWGPDPCVPFTCLLWGQATVTQCKVPGLSPAHPPNQSGTEACPVPSYSSPSTSSSHPHGNHPPQLPAPSSLTIRCTIVLDPQGNQSESQITPLCSSHPFSGRGL